MVMLLRVNMNILLYQIHKLIHLVETKFKQIQFSNLILSPDPISIFKAMLLGSKMRPV